MKFFLYVALVSVLILLGAVYVLQDQDFVRFEWTSEYQDREFDISVVLPEYEYLELSQPRSVLRSTTFEYRKPALLEGDEEESSYVRLTHARRTEPLSLAEQEKMYSLRGGHILYSEPVVSPEEGIAQSLVRVDTLPGFYTLEAPVDLVGRCDQAHTHAVVSSILLSLGPSKNYQYQPYLYRLRHMMNKGDVMWPTQEENCI